MKVSKLNMAIVASLAISSFVANATTLRLGHNTNPNGPTGQYFEMFKQAVEEKSNGDLRIRIFPNSQLGTQREMLEQVSSGLLDMTKVDTAMLENIEPMYKALNYPFVFESNEKMHEVLTSSIGQELLESTKDRGFFGLGYIMMTPRGYYSPKPINRPEDLKGMKLRVQQSNTMIRLIENIGGIPTPTPYGEVFSSLQQGMVDGVEGAGPTLYTARHGEIAKYFYEDNHVQMANVITISTRAWDRLSEEQQTIINEAAVDAMNYSYTTGWDMEMALQQKAVDTMGVTIVQPSEEQRSQMIEAVKPMYKELLDSEPGVYEFINKIKLAQQ
ncbi:TRAP transporter substrate-binding protein [Vibrio celticus]|uniref:Sialic acid-binding periplasmic protein SiaP n=1 Tax=Vibrio celticus TaxID=446372 RepID=A0A1C3JLA7_9VIBR|nr:TRAP transporter substrate-binding protein DctP [Vibrio celticus]SBT15884.1 Sialic acid-binding periplasmic protein SiaP precursor [Vibrio celticus]